MLRVFLRNGLSVFLMFQVLESRKCKLLFFTHLLRITEITRKTILRKPSGLTLIPTFDHHLKNPEEFLIILKIGRLDTITLNTYQQIKYFDGFKTWKAKKTPKLKQHHRV